MPKKESCVPYRNNNITLHSTEGVPIMPEKVIYAIIICFAIILVFIIFRLTSLKGQIKYLAQKLNTKINNVESDANKKIHSIEIELNSINNALNQAKEENKHLSDRIDQLQKQLDFYANIVEDSEKINATDDTENDAENSSEEINKVNGQTDKELDPEQEEALDLMLHSNKNMFITGKAGTGKSYLLSKFIKRTTKKALILAPTGIAALNVGGATIHSTFGYKNLIIGAFPTLKNIKEKNKVLLEQVEVIVIDEISMVSADTLEKIDILLKIINKTTAPFGNKQMLLFGDLFQLPPVTTKPEELYLEKEYGGVFFFHSNAYKNGDFHFAELTINHRQEKDKAFFEILNRIRVRDINDNDIMILNNSIRKVSSLEHILSVYPKREDAENLNIQRLGELPGHEYIYEAKVTFFKNKNLTKHMENSMPISKSLRLKVGALVMMVANDLGKRWVNGTMGIVKSLDEEKISVAINGKVYEITPMEFSETEATYNQATGKIEYENVLTVEQYPLVLAYAITIHKSQGMTYQQVACDLTRCFAPGQAYVALSRCTSLDGLVLLKHFSKTSLLVDSDVLKFYKDQVQKHGMQ